MPSLLTIAICINLLVWVALFIVMFSGSRSAVTGKNLRRGDPMRLGISVICIPIVLGNIRILYDYGDQQLLVAVIILSIIAGSHAIKLAFTYGRGPLL